MAFGVFKLTKSQRNCLSVAFLTLNMIQVVTGLIMLSISIYVYIAIAPVLYSERAEISYVFTVVGICGLNNIGCFLFALKIRHKCLKQSFKKSTRNLVFAWSCICFYIVIYLLVLAKQSQRVYKHVIRTMGHSFYIGISKYLKDVIWKISIDKIQYDLQCCGSHSYKEWHEVQWLDKTHININSETVKQYRENGSFLFPVTPWSCCRLGFPMQCLHDPLQQLKAQHIWADQPSLVLESINTEGCLSKLKVPIRIAISIFIIMVVFNFIIQVFSFIILRILYTACRNADILSDPDGIAPGWIFGRGDCGYNRGKTLMEMMILEEVPKAEQEKLLQDKPKS